MTESKKDVAKWRTTRSQKYYHIHKRCGALKGHEENIVVATPSFIRYHELSLCPNCAPLHPDNQIDLSGGRRQVRIPEQHRQCLDQLVENGAADSYTQLGQDAIIEYVEWADSVAPSELHHLKVRTSESEISVLLEQRHISAIESVMGIEQHPSVAAAIRGAVDWYTGQPVVGEKALTSQR